MKVLFYPICDYNSIMDYGCRQDYQADSLFHGVRSIYGQDCVDYQPMEHMWKENLSKLKHDKTRGFTLYGRLDNIEINRKHWKDADLVIACLHHSKYNNNQFIIDKLKELNNHYSNKSIAIIDGDDNQGCNYDLRKYGILFKRELSDNNAYNGILPIWFSIPEETILDKVPVKDLPFAPLIPCYLNRGMIEQEKTYVYDKEEDYYNDYRRSYFAFDCSKGGHDSLRHYEILSQGCLPIYTDIENVPQNTMLLYPKDVCKAIKNSGWFTLNGNVDVIRPFKPWDIPTTGHRLSDKFDHKVYHTLVKQMLNYTRKYLTTKVAATYIINEMNRFS